MNPAAKWIRRLSPSVAKADLTRFVRDLLKANTVVNALFTPADADTVVPLSHPGNFTRQSIFRVAVSNERVSGEMLPLPPVKLQYYKAQGGTDRYLTTGRADAEVIRQYLDRLGVRLNGISVMDWGCRDCRVLRHFASDARVCEFWGVDQHGPSMEWAKASLSPPFRFVTCSAYPHLPFEDRKFKLVLAYSVFTHIEHLRDMWLMEISRITAKGGIFLATIHDEHTIAYFQQTGKPCWIPPGVSLASLLRHEVSIISGLDWGNCYTFFLSDWAIREFGRYFEVLAIRPRAEDYQTALILRKR